MRSLPERQAHSGHPNISYLTSNELSPTETWKSVPPTRGTLEVAADVHSSSPITSIETSDLVSQSSAVTHFNQGGLKEPTAQDWHGLRPLALLLYEKHTIEETCAVLRDKHRFKIRQVKHRTWL